jgi:hypothetical protein
MQVPFEAYAEDCSFSGELAMTADRMSDFLSSTTEFEVLNLTCRALDDGRVVEALFAPLVRDDLCLVVAGEPRGREDLRIWTRQFAVVARVGPYTVRGYVHAPPTIDPVKLPARRSIVALTNAHLAYVEAGTNVEVEADTVLLNSAKVDVLQVVTNDEISGFELPEDPPFAGEEAPGPASA